MLVYAVGACDRRREKATGIKYELTPKQALHRMKHLLDAR
jgi:hypothetical protein